MSLSISTFRGKHIHLLSEGELGDCIVAGERLRAYCPVHGGDHQRSLSIHLESGWGHCFNATCNATVLVSEFNPDVARQLLQQYRPSVPHPDSLPQQDAPTRKTAPVRSPAPWQQNERALLLQYSDLLCTALTSYELADCWQALAYLEARGIPLEIAQQECLAYLPKDLLQNYLDDSQDTLARWSERIIFPLISPTAGRGFVGRSLWHWQIGMDEDVHKALLDDDPAAPQRWLKTNPAGWFCARPVDFSKRVILVEGPFDRLALLAGGFHSDEVVALVGTSAHRDWFPDHVQHIVVALDGDDAGIEAMWHLVNRLSEDHEVYVCPAPQEDQCGKDWSERWRRCGADGLAQLYKTFDRIH